MGSHVREVGGGSLSQKRHQKPVRIGGNWCVSVSKRCIFEILTTCQALTETQVQQQLHLEEAENIWLGGELLHTTSPSAFIMLGMDLEDSQYVL